MRRPHVYERSVPRTRREAYQEPAGDPTMVSISRDAEEISVQEIWADRYLPIE